MEPTYYAIGALQREGVDVILVVNARDHIGRARFTPSGKQRIDLKITKTRYEPVPKTALVSLWRPINPATWPEALPDPATLTRELPPPPKPKRAEEEAVAEGPFWSFEHRVPLGRPGEPPQSLDEL